MTITSKREYLLRIRTLESISQSNVESVRIRRENILHAVREYEKDKTLKYSVLVEKHDIFKNISKDKEISLLLEKLYSLSRENKLSFMVQGEMLLSKFAKKTNKE